MRKSVEHYIFKQTWNRVLWIYGCLLGFGCGLLFIDVLVSALESEPSTFGVSGGIWLILIFFAVATVCFILSNNASFYGACSADKLKEIESLADRSDYAKQYVVLVLSRYGAMCSEDLPRIKRMLEERQGVQTRNKTQIDNEKANARFNEKFQSAQLDTE